MLRNALTKALWDARRSTLYWALALAAVTMMYAGFYPSMRTPSMTQAMNSYPEGIRKAFHMEDMSTATGYLGATVFGILVPILVAIFAIMAGTRAIAGEEESGILDLLLAHPLGRIRLLLSRFAALVAQVVVVSLAVWLAVLAISKPAELTDVSIAHLTAAVVQLALLGTCFGAIAIGVGALTGRRSAGFGASALVAVLGYFADTTAPQIRHLEWLRWASPFHWYGGTAALRGGLPGLGAALLVGTAAVLIGVGVLAFRDRDIATG